MNLADKIMMRPIGHGRVLAARKLGMDLIPTIELAYLTETQRQAYSGSRLRTSDQLSRRDWAKSRQRANAAHSAKASTATPARWQIIIAALPVTPPYWLRK